MFKREKKNRAVIFVKFFVSEIFVIFTYFNRGSLEKAYRIVPAIYF